MKSMLIDKKIIVAGASGLLGSQLVIDLLDNGAEVIACDLSVGPMKNRLLSLGVDVNDKSLHLLSLDVTDQDSVSDILNNINELDGLVNCTYPRNKTYGDHFFEVNLDSFNENISLHLGSAFLLMQQCALYFKKEFKPFSYVNISSIYGVVAPKFRIYEETSMTVPVEYAAIKSAIIHLSKYVSTYVNDSRFRVNSVSPGGIMDNQPEIFQNSYKSYTHGHGMLANKDVTGAILFLLSDQSKYITGQNIVIDDGFCL